MEGLRGVDTMSRLIIRNIFANIKRTISILLGIVVAVALVYTAIGVYYSFNNMRKANAYQSYGRYNVMLHGIDESEKNSALEVLSDFNCEIGVEKICSSDKSFSLISPDDNAFSMNYYSIYEGRFPEKEGEIAICPSYKYEDKYIAVSKKLNDIIKIHGKEYIIVGILNDFDYGSAEYYKYGIVFCDSKVDEYNVYIHYTNVSDMDKAYSRLAALIGAEYGDKLVAQKDYAMYMNAKYSENEVVNWVEIEKQGTIADKNSNLLIKLIIVIIILVATILMINIFISYLDKRDKQADILKKLGYSNNAIFLCFLVEALIIFIAGTVIGILCGETVASSIVWFIQRKRIIRLINFEAYNSVEIIRQLGIFVVVAFLGVAIYLFASLKKHNTKQFMKLNKYKHKMSSGVLKILCNDARINKIEKITSFLIFVLLGMIFTIVLYVDRYGDSELRKLDNENSDICEFMLYMDHDIEELDRILAGVTDIESLDVVYETMLYYDENKAENKKLFDVAGINSCSLSGINEEHYKYYSISDEVNYEDFVATGGAILVSSGYDLKEGEIIKLCYNARQEENICNYPEGEINICGVSDLKDNRLSNGIELIVPMELFVEQFDHSHVLVMLDVSDGNEVKTANYLASVTSDLESYTFFDNITKFIYYKDNRMTTNIYIVFTVIYMLGSAIYILYHIYKHKFYRHKAYMDILSILGYSRARIIFDEFLMEMMNILPAVALANYLLVVFCNKCVHESIRRVILVDYIKDFTVGIFVVLAVELIAVLLNYSMFKDTYFKSKT